MGRRGTLGRMGRRGTLRWGEDAQCLKPSRGDNERILKAYAPPSIEACYKLVVLYKISLPVGLGTGYGDP